MVYRGKPSLGCHSCRNRRIKCDRGQPGCTQCSNIHIECPGYRNVDDLFWRNENATVARKAQASYGITTKKRRQQAVPSSSLVKHQSQSPSPSVSSWSSCSDPDFNTDYQNNDHLFLWPGLFLPTEDIGLSYFMSTFVPGSHYEYLPALYNKEKKDCALHTIVHAAALAALSREWDHPALMDSARNSYSNALVMTNRALTDSTIATQDSTLVSVLLLSLFEAMIWDGVATPNNWTAHINGALALVKMRGDKQFDTELGRQLFHQVATNIRASCVQRRERIPPELNRIMPIARRFTPKNDPRLAFGMLLSELTELSAGLKDGTVAPLEGVQIAVVLDDKYARIGPMLPPFDIVPREEGNTLVFGSTYHRYESHQNAQIWNSWRMIRILINAFIWGYSLAEETPSLEGLRIQAAATVEEMARGICACVPHIMKVSPLSGNYKSCVASLLWPLSVVRGQTLVSNEVRGYAIERLKSLGQELKILPAQKLAQTDNYELNAFEDGLFMFYLS